MGAEHLKTLQNENKKNRASAGPSGDESDFHFELLRLRQNWRLKKVSNTILGDLSYRTAGSLYKQSGKKPSFFLNYQGSFQCSKIFSGVFEVVKADDHGAAAAANGKDAKDGGQASQTQAEGEAKTPQQQQQQGQQKSSLKVKVPSELEGIAYIQARKHLTGL